MPKTYEEKVLEEFDKKFMEFPNSLGLETNQTGELKDFISHALKEQREEILKSKITKKEIFIRGLDDKAINYIK